MLGKKLSVPFSQQDTQEISQPGRQNWLVSQPPEKWAATKPKNDNFLHRTSKWAWPKSSNRPFSGGEGGGTLSQTSKWAWQKASISTFSGGGGHQVPGGIEFTYPRQNMLPMLQNIITSKTSPSTAKNWPASSSKHLQLCQPPRFLWGTDKARNRFVECPCL